MDYVPVCVKENSYFCALFRAIPSIKNAFYHIKRSFNGDFSD